MLTLSRRNVNAGPLVALSFSKASGLPNLSISLTLILYVLSVGKCHCRSDYLGAIVTEANDALPFCRLF
jgi:hypothetical protein